MIRSFMTGAALLFVARTATAQMPGAAAKAAAQKAASGTNAHIEAEQRVDQQPAPKPAPTKAQEIQTERPGSKLAIATTDTSGPPPTILREAFEYAKDGRRDPFVSLLTTNDLRPTMSDLRLSGILFDQSGRRSVATLRDVATNAQYKVTIGSTLGRMRVAAIRLKTIVFTIDEFGTTRQDSLILGDSTKARGK
ncbi:MAG TPA: hypothetical protein VK636_00400 [Gemmatimonadaceae bacterium]|nr:hypothetical protein [Gemmatimonadaceae bacterium]